MSWEIIASLITIGGFLITLITFATKFNSVITECTCAIKELRNTLDRLLKEQSDTAHRLNKCESDINAILVRLEISDNK